MMPRLIRKLLYMGFALCLLGLFALWIGYKHLDRTPSELLRYTERRLYGHTRLENIFLPILHAIRARVERPIIESNLPSLGKGNQPRALATVQYNSDGRPLETVPSLQSDMSIIPNQTPGSTEDIIRAVTNAKAGTVIEIRPGRYRIRTSVRTGNAGTPSSPIVVRAAEPGTVTIELAATEGFHVLHPYWTFENLVIRGTCNDDSSCEHAFHIVGKARGTVVRNNRIEDFNAHIKVNGLGDDWPDFGLIQFNTLTNSRRRETHHPVTPIDIVGASYWLVADNLISNFVKGDGDHISYGVFMKGAGNHGRIERNLIICTERDISQKGVRVGLSFGGGTTGKPYCRDKRCDAEHTKGIAANNVIALCNDFGIDINRSSEITVAHNTLINTSGIDVRAAPASAAVYGNLLDGRIRARDDGWIGPENNLSGSLDRHFRAPDQLDLSWRDRPKTIPTPPRLGNDFCNQPRPSDSLPGAIGMQHSCASSH